MTDFSGLIGGLGDLFGSVGDDFMSGGSTPTDISGLFDTSNFDTSGVLSGGLGGTDITSLFGDGGGALGGGGSFDISSLFGGGTPIPQQTAPTDLSAFGLIPSSDPTSNLFTGAPANVGSLLTPSGAYTPTGGSTPLNLQTITNTLPGLIAGSGNAGGAANPGLLLTPSGLVNGTGGLVSPGPTINPATGGTGGLGGLLGGNTSSLLAALGGLGAVGGLFGSPSLGPAADALNAQAKNNTDLVNNQIMPTALANQQGMVNNQLLNTEQSQLAKSEAAMRSRYAEMGESGSSMEAEDLAGLRQNAQDQVFQEGQQMAQSGLSEAATLSGQDAGIYGQLMQAQVQQDAALQQAIARVAAAFAGGSPAAAGSGS